jgi:hypothetical protein
MQQYHTVTKIAPNGLPVLDKLPFQEGEVVEVTIESKNGKKIKRTFPYRGKKPFKYIDPFEPAMPAEEWDVMKDDPA